MNINTPATCFGCHWLARGHRPMCRGENSPHYRQPRDTYHARCGAFAVNPPKPTPEPAPPLSIAEQYAALRQRNLSRRVA